MSLEPGQILWHHSRSYLHRVKIVGQLEGPALIYHVHDEDDEKFQFHAQEKDLFFSELAAQQAALGWLERRVKETTDTIAFLTK